MVDALDDALALTEANRQKKGDQGAGMKLAL